MTMFLTFDCRQVVGDDVAWKYHSERHLARVLCGDCGRVGTSCACRAAAVRWVQGRAAVSGWRHFVGHSYVCEHAFTLKILNPLVKVTLNLSLTDLWSPYLIGQTIYIFILFLSFLFPRLISAVGDWMSAILPHMVWPWCEFRIQVWNMLHVARCKYRTQKWRKKCGNHPTTLSGYITTEACIDNRKKKLVKQPSATDVLTIWWTSAY